MSRSAFDPALLTRGLTYLYRWWLQTELGIVPEAHVRRAGIATLIGPEWAITASASPIALTEISRQEDDLKRSVFVFCPDLHAEVPGWDVKSGLCRNLIPIISKVANTLIKYSRIISQLGEENPERDEWWKTRDWGEFKIWGGRSRRLLLYPKTGQVYGYAITVGTDGTHFFYRSRSCREEGRMTKTGIYKMSEHALPSTRHVSNLDLYFPNDKVLLLQLRPVGGGFKVFPRRVPGFEGSIEQ